MFGRRSEGPLNGGWTDESLERAVEAALDVEPAPEFLARVRTRVALEPSPHRRWSIGRWPLAIAGAALVLLAAFLEWPTPRPSDESTTRPGVSSGAERASAPAGVPDVPLADDDSHVRVATGTDDTVRVARVEKEMTPKPARSVEDGSELLVQPEVEPLQLPEVVIAPDERLALVLLLSPPSPQEPEVVVADLPDLGSIEVPEVVVEPLAQVARLEGDLP